MTRPTATPSVIMQARRLLDSRGDLTAARDADARHARESGGYAEAAEGGCGVIGLACDERLAARHLIAASEQMHNRGNGKGGGIAAAGLDPDQLGVSAEILRTHTLLQIAYLDRGARAEVERECLESRFDIAAAGRVPHCADYRDVAGLEIEPPEVARYFCRVKPDVLADFAERHGLRGLAARRLEDEYVYQNSYRLNQRYYASLGRKRAFVLSHGRDLLVFKIVGYAEQAAWYYRLEDLTAHVWIAHQRYPTKGRVWHPGGAHPFVGVNEALVHNGDFANYHRVTEYLRQRNILPLFLTDTEVSALLFDLWDRIYRYPLEVVLEALAPTCERDFDQLAPEKQALYRAVQHTHLQASPDGPWFFIIARSRPDEAEWDLLGITDTSMLRPQVFAWYEGNSRESGVRIGLVASERQAINSCLRSLAAADARFTPLADRYWVARGGSHTDGGAFNFTVKRAHGVAALVCRNKFGDVVAGGEKTAASIPAERAGRVRPSSADGSPAFLRESSLQELQSWLLNTTTAGLADLGDGEALDRAIRALLSMRDRRFDCGVKKRSAVTAAFDRALFDLLRGLPGLRDPRTTTHRRIDATTHADLRPPARQEKHLVIDAAGFAPEGSDSAARLIAQAFQSGWRRILAFDLRGGRFAGCGLGPKCDDARIDLVGDPGDYVASGLDGGEIVIHGDAQDQVGQILSRGRLVIHGDVGQTFLYGAKGGDVFVRGDAAGRPLINAVGRPRVIINGTCLDYLAESFMAGDPLNGGGFVIVNGIRIDDHGVIHELESPYPGSTLFSLASGGAVYLRDPRDLFDEDQLNGGCVRDLETRDWELIAPLLRENERLFGIPVDRLLSFDGGSRPPERIYRKIAVDPRSCIS